MKLEKALKPDIGDIRIRYYQKSAKSATILAQQWETLNDVTTFRTFNLWNPNANQAESTQPTEQQLKRNLGCCKMFKSIIGGLAVSYIDRAERGVDYNIDNLLYLKLDKQLKKVRRLRIIWWFWLTIAYYGLLVPFTAELACIPMIGALLLRLESQTGVMAIFGLTLCMLTWLLYCSFLVICYKPVISIQIWLIIAIILTVMLTKGESIPKEYAEYKLGYF